MVPVEFKEVNEVYAKDQPQYRSLPVFKNDSPEGEVVACWKLSFKERLKILFKGELWMMMMTFNRPLTPVKLTVNKSDVLATENE